MLQGEVINTGGDWATAFWMLSFKHWYQKEGSFHSFCWSPFFSFMFGKAPENTLNVKSRETGAHFFHGDYKNRAHFFCANHTFDFKFESRDEQDVTQAFLDSGHRTPTSNICPESAHAQGSAVCAQVRLLALSKLHRVVTRAGVGYERSPWPRSGWIIKNRPSTCRSRLKNRVVILSLTSESRVLARGGTFATSAVHWRGGGEQKISARVRAWKHAVRARQPKERKERGANFWALFVRRASWSSMISITCLDTCVPGTPSS